MLTNEQIARIAAVASTFPSSGLLEHVHDLRTGFDTPGESAVDRVIMACLEVDAEQSGETAAMVDYQALEVRSGALNAAISFFKGAKDEAKIGASVIVTAAQTFEKYLTGAVDE